MRLLGSRGLCGVTVGVRTSGEKVSPVSDVGFQEMQKCMRSVDLSILSTGVKRCHDWWDQLIFYLTPVALNEEILKEIKKVDTFSRHNFHFFGKIEAHPKMAADSVSCRLSSFVLFVGYCFELLLSAVHSFSAVCFWLGLLLMIFQPEMLTFLIVARTTRRLFIENGKNGGWCAASLLRFERAHSTLEPRRTQ